MSAFKVKILGAVSDFPKRGLKKFKDSFDQYKEDFLST
jgi:hypothetical protein